MTYNCSSLLKKNNTEILPYFYCEMKVIYFTSFNYTAKSKLLTEKNDQIKV